MEIESASQPAETKKARTSRKCGLIARRFGALRHDPEKWARTPSGFLLHRDRNICICRKPNLVALDVGDETAVDEVVMALVLALPAVGLRQLDAFALDAIDGADMGAVRTDDFHMLFDAADVGHG
jgi:hypothetical protein